MPIKLVASANRLPLSLRERDGVRDANDLLAPVSLTPTPLPEGEGCVQNEPLMAAYRF